MYYVIHVYHAFSARIRFTDLVVFIRGNFLIWICFCHSGNSVDCFLNPDLREVHISCYRGVVAAGVGILWQAL